MANAVFSHSEFCYVPSAGHVHSGFLYIYQQMRDRIVNVVGELPGSMKLLVTGHSLGGALATLAAADLAWHYVGSQVNLYTFASPRVGDRDFVELFLSLISSGSIESSFRIVNMLDQVTQLPPEEVEDAITRKKVLYRHVEFAKPFSQDFGQVWDNHDLENYRIAVEMMAG